MPLRVLQCDSRVARVDVVDMNPAQLHLVQVKRGCVSGGLSPEEQLNLLNHGDMRLWKRIRDGLPQSTRVYWEERIEELEFGINRSGVLV